MPPPILTQGPVSVSITRVVLLALAIGVGLAMFAFWIWAIIEAIRNPGLDESTRVVWVLVIVLLHVLGALLYIAFGRRSRPPG